MVVDSPSVFSSPLVCAVSFQSIPLLIGAVEMAGFALHLETLR